MNLDFVIPCHEKDFETLNLCVKCIKQNISNINNIYIISNTDLKIKNTIYVPEQNFNTLISLQAIKNIWETKNKQLSYRSAWLYQQFLKLLSYRVIKQLSEQFVVVDADTLFLRDISFDSNKFQYCIANEYHQPYLHPIKHLLNVSVTIEHSCICHHMVFQKSKLDKLIYEIESRFNLSFVDAVLACLNYNELSCFSEWDLYANFMLINFPELCEHRQLKWLDINYIPEQKDIEILKKKFNFVSCHAYRRDYY